MSVYHKGEKITDFYKFEDELGRYFKLSLPSNLEVHLLLWEVQPIKGLERKLQSKSLKGMTPAIYMK